MSTDAAAKIPSHQPSKRSRAPPPPPTKKLSFEEDKNGSASEQEKEALKNNGDLGDASEVEERQLTVVLPGEKLIKASVKNDTPILELLIMIASKNHLNPTGHMIAQPAPRPRDPPIMLKPNQRLTDVVGDTIYIIPRNQKQLFVHKKEDRKSAVYEPTTRITVISGKNHKMCLRVDPDKTLQDLLPIICDERGVDPSNHMLRLVTQPQEPLDISQTLEKTGVIEFLLVDLNGQPAGGEVDLLPEQKKKKGLFGRISKKKKGYEFGGGGTAPPDTAATSTIETEQRARRHTSPSSFPAPDPPAPIQEQDDANSNTLKKRRPAPPPPQGKQNVAGSGGASEDDEKSEDDPSSATSFNSLRKRRAPAPPRPTSPPRRSMSLGASSAPVVHDFHVPPPRPISPPHWSSEEAKLDDRDIQGFSPIPEGKPRPPKPPRPTSIVRRISLESAPRPFSKDTPEFIPPPPPYQPPSPGRQQEDVTKLIEEGRLNESFEESSPSIHTGSVSSSVTDTGIDESFQEAIAMGISSSEFEAKEDNITAPNEDAVDEEIAGLTVDETSVQAKGEDKQEAEPTALAEGATKAEMDEEKERDDSSQPEEKAVLATNASYVKNAKNELGGGIGITETDAAEPGAHPKKFRPRHPFRVYAVYDEGATPQAVDDVQPPPRRSRAKSDSSILQVPIRSERSSTILARSQPRSPMIAVRSGRSSSVLEMAKPLKGMRFACVPESIDLTESPTTTASSITEEVSPKDEETDRLAVAVPSENQGAVIPDPLTDMETTSASNQNASIGLWSTDKENKAKRELLSHMMTMSLDDDTKDTENYPPHTQADDTHMLLEEKSVHALAFEVTREDISGDSQEIADGTFEENEKGVDFKKPESEESPKSEVSVEKLNEQYAALQGQLAALQKQVTVPQQPGIMEIQLQQLQQQILLQQQMISQMMMTSNQPPMVMPLAYHQAMMTPQQQMMLAQQRMMSPPQPMMVSPQQQIIAQQMVSPQQQLVLQQQQMVSPQQSLISPQQMISPQQQMVSPQQMALTAQQLLVTPPLLYSSPAIPQTTIPTGNSPESTTATVQAQHTPISSTHEVNVSTESPIKDEDVPNKEEEMPAKEAVATDVQTELQQRPLSPPLKADEVTVGHPTYHFARSHNMPKRESLVIATSPPSTLRSHKEQQRPALYKAEEGSPESKSEKEEILSRKTELTESDKSQSHVDDKHKASPTADLATDQDQIQANGGEDVEKDTTKTSDHPTADTTDSSSISAYAVLESQPSDELESSKVPKSPKQKKTGFSLFKKKTPKYSYILSAQKEFSRKSDTERQQTNSNPAKPIDAKAKSDKGARDLWSR